MSGSRPVGQGGGAPAAKVLSMSGAGNGAAVQVTPYGRGWAVRLAAEGQPVSIHESLADAAAEGRRVAAQLDTELVVYGEAWQVLKRVRPDQES